MYRIGATVTATVVAGGIVGVAMLGGASATPEQARANAEHEVEQFQGRIVNLYFHMTEPEEYWNDNDNDNGLFDWDDDNDNDMQHDRPRRPDRQQMMRDTVNPLAIIVEEDRLIGTTTNTYVLIFEERAGLHDRPAQPGQRPGQQPGQRPGQQPGDQHQPDRDRPMGEAASAQRLRQMIGQNVTLRGIKYERDDLTVIKVESLEGEVRPGAQPGARPGQEQPPRR